MFSSLTNPLPESFPYKLPKAIRATPTTSKTQYTNCATDWYMREKPHQK
jgi:hypothetical protein